MRTARRRPRRGSKVASPIAEPAVVTEPLRLYSYWRSSAAYRVRIGLGLKKLPYETVPVHLIRDGGEQHSEAFREANPQELVPVLQHGARLYRQSMAILEYLDETWPTPPLLPALARDRARARALAQTIACDIHPLNNLRVLRHLAGLGVEQAARDDWYRHWVREGLDALEALAAPRAGAFLFGDAPTLADVCLVPQMYNARRFNVPLEAYPALVRADAAAAALEPFAAAHPDRVAPAPASG